MPGYVISTLESSTILSASGFLETLQSAKFESIPVTLVGYGGMGKEYLKALETLKVKNLRICSRSSEKLEPLHSRGYQVISGGYGQLKTNPEPGEVAVVATPTLELVPTINHLLDLGFKKILCEKPVSLWSSRIDRLQAKAAQTGAEVWTAYNRVAYPSFIEARYRAERDGGITSCGYTFTEFIDRMDPWNYPPDEQHRWGVANSLHVMSMAHGLIGLPQDCKTWHQGGLDWHPTGNLFVGSGRSVRGIPFVYHADWGSKGRWSVEIHTRRATYRFCPLEKLLIKTDALKDFTEIPVPTLAPEIKVGFVEEVAALLRPEFRATVPLFSLAETAQLTRFGESVFGYSADQEAS